MSESCFSRCFKHSLLDPYGKIGQYKIMQKTETLARRYSSESTQW